MQELVRCIRLNLDRADACAQLRATSSPGQSAGDVGLLRATIQACAPPCRARSVTGTPPTTTTVASAPEPAAAASRPATTSSPRPADQRDGFLGRGSGRWLPTFVHGARRGRNKPRLPPVGRCFRAADRAGRLERSSARDVLLLAEGHLPLPRALRACRQPHEPRAQRTSCERPPARDRSSSCSCIRDTAVATRWLLLSMQRERAGSSAHECSLRVRLSGNSSGRVGSLRRHGREVHRL